MKTILNTSNEAATYKTEISGWVSHNGRFWGKDERAARWDGCTHIVCECGQPVEKRWTKCSICRSISSDKRFAALESKSWDGKTPLCLYDDDRFFWSEDDLTDFCEEIGAKPEDLKLVICEPIYAREIDPNDYYCDDLPEDGEITDDLLAAFEELNQIIRGSKVIFSWSPSKYAAALL